MLVVSASPALVLAGERRPESPQSVNEAWAAAALLAGAVLPAHATDDGVIYFGSNINPPPPEYRGSECFTAEANKYEAA